ncbi:MAG: radical SAM protein [Candidatus Azosocius agrarius]|nr:MAG: radical SAM protein [Gammaproteobacteria bacterium]
MNLLQDSYGRTFPYLRLSITDVCNFKCKYCLPYGYFITKKNFLTKKEIINLVAIFSELGVEKIRITGGEPTIRKDFLSIARGIKLFSSIKSLVFTTNGYKLEKIVNECNEIGFSGINISVDSLNEYKFKYITGSNFFIVIFNGIIKSISFKLKIKINVVLMKPFTLNDLEFYLEFIRITPVSVRFIELMETVSSDYFNKYYIRSIYIKNYLLNCGWFFFDNLFVDGPAIILKNINYRGDIGLIAPYLKNFCISCNRLRISSSGNLHLCLFGNINYVYSLKFFLKKNNKKKLINFIKSILISKNLSHKLYEGNSSFVKHLSDIGG